MYVGPWQEYNLSKQRSGRSIGRGNDAINITSSSNSSINHLSTQVLKKGFEDALTKSLEPDAAQLALKVMESVLSQQQQEQIHPLSLNNSYKVLEDQALLPGEVREPRVDARRAPPRSRKVDPNRYDINSLVRQQQLKQQQVQFQQFLQFQQFQQMQQMNQLHPYQQQMQESFPRQFSARNTQDSPLPSVRSTKSEPIIGESSSLSSSLRSKMRQNSNSRESMEHDSLSAHMRQQKREHRQLQQLQHEHKQSNTHIQQQQRTAELHNNSSQSIELKTNSSDELGVNDGSYDAAALINFLRMERNQRAKLEISRLAGWHVMKSNEMDSNSEKRGSSKIDPVLVARQLKIDQVNQMKQLYISESLAANNTQQPSSSSSSSISASQEAQHHKSVEFDSLSHAMANNKSPIKAQQDALSSHVHINATGSVQKPGMRDMDITDNDLLQISKYFNSLEGSPSHSSSQSISNKNQSSLNTTAKASYKTPTGHSTMAMDDSAPPSRASPNKSMMHEDSPFEKSIRSPANNSISEHRVIGTPGSTYADELYVNGVDGLLKWSKQLNLDLDEF